MIECKLRHCSHYAMASIHILHENHDWTAPLKRELDALSLPHEDWHLDQGGVGPKRQKKFLLGMHLQ